MVRKQIIRYLTKQITPYPKQILFPFLKILGEKQISVNMPFSLKLNALVRLRDINPHRCKTPYTGCN